MMVPTPNFIVPTPAVSDSSNRVASTEFVTLAVATAVASAIAGLTIPVVATQAQMETGTSTAVFTAPGVQQFHPGNAKAWLQINGTATIVQLSAYNCTPTDNGTGDVTVDFTIPFAAATSYAGVATCGNDGTALTGAIAAGPVAVAQTSAAFHVRTFSLAGVGADTGRTSYLFFGDRA